MARERIVLDIPELPGRPVVGGGCCAVPAAEAIEQSLCGWRGVRGVQVDVTSGRVEAELDEDGPGASDLVWSLRMLGFEEVRPPDEHA